jgi:hypothetical protein
VVSYHKKTRVSREKAAAYHPGSTYGMRFAHVYMGLSVHENADVPPTACATSWYGTETLGTKFYMRRETLRLFLVFCTDPFWYTL